METTFPDGPNTGKTTLLHDLIRIQTDKPIVVIDTSNEIADNESEHPIFKKADEDE